MTEGQWWLTVKILISRINPRKFVNKAGWVALMDYGVSLAREYDSGKLTKEQYWDLKTKGKSTFHKLNTEQENFNSRRNAGRVLSAITGALQGHLQQMQRMQHEQVIEMQRNQRNIPPSYNCNTGRVYGSGSNRWLNIKCNPQ